MTRAPVFSIFPKLLIFKLQQKFYNMDHYPSRLFSFWLCVKLLLLNYWAECNWTVERAIN